MIDIILAVFFRGFELFYAPIVAPQLLWVVIPVYIQWFLTSTYQEKRETRFGNAIVNGFVSTWVGLDWSKTLYEEIVSGTSSIEIFRLFLSVALIVYGSFIIIEAFRGRKYVKYIGRMREVSYFIIVLTPVFYAIIPPDLFTIAAIAVYFPITYAISGFVARYVPYPGEGVEEPLEAETKPALSFEPEPAVNNTETKNFSNRSYSCPNCGSSLDYVQQYEKYFCRRCNRYI